MNRYIIIVLLVLFTVPSYAQIGINTETPDVSAVLDITSTSKGVLLPSMSTVQKNGITSPAHSLLVYDTSLKCISQNLGTAAIPSWTCLTLYDKQFFYMPSINIETDVLNTTQTKDLFGQYETEFATPVVKNPSGSATNIPRYGAGDLFYYVTYYDPSVIQIEGISDNGVMTYRIVKEADFDAYMNVVFVVK